MNFTVRLAGQPVKSLSLGSTLGHLVELPTFNSYLKSNKREMTSLFIIYQRLKILKTSSEATDQGFVPRMWANVHNPTGELVF